MDLKCFPTQFDFLLDAVTKIIIWIGGRGCGKTYALALWCLMQSMRLPNSRGVVVSSNNPQLRQATIPDFTKVYDYIGIEYQFDRWLNVISFANGSSFKFQSLDVPPESVKGGNLHWMAGDEIDGCPEEHLHRLMMAVREEDGTRLVRFVGNSPPVQHWIETWVWEHAAKAVDKKPIAKLMQSSSFENTTLPKDVLDMYLAQYPVGSVGYRRWILGEMGVPLEGLVFHEFDRRHVITADKVPWDRVVGFVGGLDLGYNHHTVFLRAAVTEWDEVYIYAEHAGRMQLLKDHAEAIIQILDKKLPVREDAQDDGAIYCDTDLQDRAELDELGLPTVPAIKHDREASIDCVNRRFRENKLFIVGDACPRLMLELPYYTWQEGKDEPIKENDHAMDALRYLVGGLDLRRDELELE
jgi:PBSX family phage terminase large subunit